MKCVPMTAVQPGTAPVVRPAACRPRAWHRALIGLSLWAAALMASAGPTTITVAGNTASLFAGGIKLGELAVSPYEGGQQFEGEDLKARIAANFSMTGIQAGGAAQLAALAPLGLTYLQTLQWGFDSGEQQRIFQDRAGQDLKGTQADPPYQGYTIYGARDPSFANDRTPWYSDIQPGGRAGDLPPSYAAWGGNQFLDTPLIRSVADVNGITGLLNLLIGRDADGKDVGMDGYWTFETALVGVIKAPQDDAATPAVDEAFTGTYKVNTLAAFTWGFEFDYLFDILGDGLTWDDWDVGLKPLGFSAGVSGDFWSAFDKAGANADVEWLIPEPSTLILLLWGLLLPAGFRRPARRARAGLDARRSGA